MNRPCNRCRWYEIRQRGFYPDTGRVEEFKEDKKWKRSYWIKFLFESTWKI
jgi:hypothetical protein